METKFVNISDRGLSHHFCFYSGCSTQEMTALILAIFGTTKESEGSTLAGLSDLNGEFISLEEACESPEMLGDHTYGLVFGYNSADYNDQSYDDNNEEEDEEEEEEIDEETLAPLFDFVDTLLSDRQVNPTQAKVLNSLIQKGSQDIFNAFELYDVTNDVILLKDTLILLADEFDEEFHIQELNDFVETLLKQNYISIYEAGVLKTLISECDERVLEALARYDENNNVFELRDDLVGLSKQVPGTSIDNTEEFEETKEETVANLNKFIDELQDNDYVTDIQAVNLRYLISKMDGEVLHAFDEYQVYYDFEKLKKSLIKFADTHQANEELNNSSNLDASAYCVLDYGHIAKQAYRFVEYLFKNNSIDENEKNVLLDLISDGDETIFNAFHEAVTRDVFASELRDEMISLAKLKLFKDAQYTALSTVIESMVNKIITKDDGDKLRMLIQTNHELIVAAWDAFLYDNDLEELKDTLARIARIVNVSSNSTMQPSLRPDAPTPNQDAFASLIDEWEEHDIISSGQSLLIKQLLREKFEPVMEAFEIYDANYNEHGPDDGQDEHELLDTLLHILSHVNSSSLNDSADSRLDVLVFLENAYKGGALSLKAFHNLTAYYEDSGDNVYKNKIVKAHEHFLNTSDYTNFIDTLQNISNSISEHDDEESDDDYEEVEEANEEEENEEELEQLRMQDEEGALILINFVGQLEDEEIISSAGAEWLKGRITNRDDFLFAAYDVFTTSDDAKELCDNLLHLVMRATNELDGHEVNDITTESMQAEAEAEAEEGYGLTLPKVISYIENDSLKRVLIKAYNEENEFVLAAFEVFSEDQNLDDLIETLLRFAHKNLSKEDEEEDDDEEEEEEDVNNEALSVELQKYLHSSPAFSTQEKDILLSDLETRTGSYEMLLGAFHAYIITSDEGDMIETMKLIVNNQDSEILNFNFVSILQFLENEALLTEKQTRQLRSILHTEKEEIMIAAYENYLENQILEDFVDTLIRLSDTIEDEPLNNEVPSEIPLENINQIIDIMVRNNNLSQEIGFVIGRLCAVHYEPALAIFDQFVEDRNLEDLQDSIVRIYLRTVTDQEDDDDEEEEDAEEEEEVEDDDEEEEGEKNTGQIPIEYFSNNKSQKPTHRGRNISEELQELYSSDENDAEDVVENINIEYYSRTDGGRIPRHDSLLNESSSEEESADNEGSKTYQLPIQYFSGTNNKGEGGKQVNDDNQSELASSNDDGDEFDDNTTETSTNALVSAQHFRKIIEQEELQDVSQVLLKLYKNNDPLLNGCLESYYDDNEKLTSYLRRLAKRVNL